MTEMNSYQDIIRRSGFIQNALRADPVTMGLSVGGQYNATLPTITDGKWSTLQLDSKGRLWCRLDSEITINGSNFDVDVSAFVNSSGTEVDGAMIFTHDESLAAKSEIWQGFGGYDKTGDKFKAYPISVDDSAMPATPDFVGVGGEYRAAATTYTDGDATILQTDINGYLKVTQANTEYIDDSNGFTVASSKGLAIMGLATSDAVDVGDIGALRMDVNRNLGVTASADIPTTLTGGSKTVTTHGTAEALGTTLAIKSIYIRAKATNTSFICIGDSSVDEATNQQIVLYANDSITLDISNRLTVYVDADVDGEGVDYLCMS